MKLCVAAAVVAAICLSSSAAVNAVPTFPSEWVSDQAQRIGIFQGGTHPSADEYCCDKKAGQCKVQTQGLTGVMYVDGANNRTSLSVGSQAIINLFEKNKQISAVASQSGKGWTCKSYCPEDQDFYSPLTVDPSAKDLGKTTYLGKQVEHWQWADKILKVIQMDLNDFYVDNSGSSPSPVAVTQLITPFGGPAIGESESVFNNFKGETPPASTWEIDNLDSCEESQNCNQNSAQRFFGPKLSLYQIAKKTAAEVLKEEAPRFVEPKVARRQLKAAWPKDWMAVESQGMVINQGGVPSKDGSSICCQSSFGGQCQVQVQYQSGQKYFDYSHNRTRFEASNGQIFVDLYGSVLKSLEVVHNGTHDVCKAYCPIDPEDTLDAGRDYFLDSNASDLGKTTFDGQPAEHWQWKDTIFKVITMQTTDFYANTDGDSVLPLGAVDTLTPFGGPAIGHGNTSWTGFKTGTPPASKFDVQGVDECPQDPQCGQQARQIHRFASKQMHTFMRYMEQLN